MLYFIVMLRKLLCFGVLLTLLSTWRVTAEAPRIASKPEVKGIQSFAITFTPRPNSPNPNEIFTLVNQARVNAGLIPLKADEHLANLAELRANDMASNQYYSHRNKEGKFYFDALKEQGIYTDYSCENLDIEFSESALPYITAWLGSNAGHRECMLHSQVTSAGYAAIKLPQKNPDDTSTYIVVAIHATDVKKQ